MAEALRLQGNALFARQQYSEAIAMYTQSLALELNAKTLGIRSQAHFLSNHFSFAYCDASHALALLVGDEKEDITTYRKRQSNAEKHLFELASKTNHTSADFFSTALEVFDTPSQGRGLRTTRLINEGELLVIASPLVCVENEEKPKAMQEMALKLMQCKDKEVLQCVNDLDDGSVDGSAEQLDVKQVLKLNAFQLGNASQHYALYHMPSLVNHACDANLMLVFFGQTLVLRAGKRLQCGEQVTIRYFPANDMFARERQLYTQNTWGFTCMCTWCQNEQPQGEELRKEAAELCDLFFKGEHLAEVAKKLTEFVTSKLDLTNVYCAGAFAGVLQVYRACMENVGNADEAYKMQDLLMGMFATLEPSSFEHCKLAALCVLFAAEDENRKKRCSELSKRVHETRYGTEPLLLEHAMQQSQLALLTKSAHEWTLTLAS